MTFLPVAQRELIVAARRAATFQVRWTAALLALLTGGSVLVFAGKFGGSQGVGGALFTFLSVGAFVFALGAGVFLTADSVSQERREGTLGLLFLTDLGGLDVVAGKFLAGGLNAFYGLLAVLPVLAMAWTLGGVTAGEFARTALVLLNTLFLSLCAGIWVSVSAVREAQALSRTALGLTALALVPLILLGVQQLVSAGPPAFILGDLSPVLSLFLARATQYGSHTAHFWGSLLSSHALAWLLIAVASVQLRRSWRKEEPGETSAARSDASATAPRSVDSTPVLRLDRRLLEANPIMALTCRDTPTERLAWIVATVCALLLAAVITFLNAMLSFSVQWLISALIWLPLKLIIAWRAGTFLGAARRDGSLELMLTTPLTDFQILQGQWLGLRRMFFRPALMLALTGVVVEALFSVAHADGALSVFTGVGIALTVGGLFWLTLFVDLQALVWVSFWLALTEPRSGVAFLKAVLRVVILPMAFFCVPNLVLNGVQLSWAQDKFRMNLRAILQGARTVWPVK